MYEITLVLAGVILALAYSSVINSSSNKSAKAVIELPPLQDCGIQNVDASPTFRMNAELGAVDDGSKVTATVRCKESVADPKVYYTNFHVVSNLYDSSARPPENIADPVPDDDNLEHVKVFFANDEGQILEVKLNRFGQESLRLLSKPHNELKRKGLPSMGCSFSPPYGYKFYVSCLIDSALLPKKVTKMNVVDVNPMNKGHSRYLMNYRLYNHPISIYDTQVLSKYMKFNPNNVVHPDGNMEDSEYWIN